MADSAPVPQLWPLHPKPIQDELLSSWIVRLAKANAMKLSAFCAETWPRRSIWNRDIDKCADQPFLAALADRTGASSEKVAATCLASYEGLLYEEHIPKGKSQWIMPIGVYHWTRRNFGLQFCPACLDEDSEPFFRKSWRLAWTTVCTRHHLPLRDRCEECGSPVQFFRGDVDSRSKIVPDPLTQCHICRKDLRRAFQKLGAERCDTDYCVRQQALNRIVQQGWQEIPGSGPVYVHLYFIVLRQLVRILATDRNGVRLREHAVSRYGLPPFRLEPQLKGNEFEQMRPGDRRRLLSVALSLLSEWPDGFVEACASSQVWSSTLLRDMARAPFWYWSIVKERLYRASAVPSAADRHWMRIHRVGIFGKEYSPPKCERKKLLRCDWAQIMEIADSMPPGTPLRERHAAVVEAGKRGDLTGHVPVYGAFCRRKALD